MIRARIAAGVSIRYLVPPAIEAMIAELGLYRRNGASATG
jgi:nicotinic acid mononucleotide adenylyltransferase